MVVELSFALHDVILAKEYKNAKDQSVQIADMTANGTSYHAQCERNNRSALSVIQPKT
jgi:hypothetical protein